MVHAKRRSSPPQRPSNKAPRLTSWKNHARSCFAIELGRPLTTPDYIHWTEDPSHRVLLILQNITVGAGALPPHSSTAIHSHHHNSVVLSVKNTPSPGLVLQTLNPPEYIHRQSQQIQSLTTGHCFSQLPYSSKLPLVHRAVTSHHGVAFLLIESSAPPLLESAPTLVVDKSPYVRAESKTSTNFWAAAEITIDPGAEAVFDSYAPSSPLLLARFICPLQCSLDYLKVQLPVHVRRDTVKETLEATLFQTIAISGFRDTSDTGIQIANSGPDAWSGIVFDIFGALT